MSNDSKYIGYIGTYTKGESKGIYTFTLDTKESKLINLKLAAELENPTYLAISQDNHFLYSVVKEGESGGVAAYSISETGELQAINNQVSAGSPPCYVSVDSKNHFCFSANYHKGTVDSYLINQQDGSVQPPTSSVKHEGKGPDPRQEKPHTHFVKTTPNEKYIAVAELGTDALITYEVSQNGTLKEASRLTTHPGSGPRHLVFHPNNQFAYIMTEFSSEVIVLSYHDEDGSFSEIQHISTIPEDFKENNQGSAIHLSSDGRFVYAGNRGHNSIAIFSTNQETGVLSFVERTSSEGDWPRDFEIDPTGKFIVASNQESNNLVLFARDENTGKLSLLKSDIVVPYPVCVKFLNY